MKSKEKTIFSILLLLSAISMLLIWVQEIPDNIVPEPDNVLSPQNGQEQVPIEDKESSEYEYTSESDQEPVSSISTEENKPSEKSSDLETTELITSTNLTESTSMNITDPTFEITDGNATAASNISSTITKTNQTNQSDSNALIVITTTADNSKDTDVPTVQ